MKSGPDAFLLSLEAPEARTSFVGYRVQRASPEPGQFVHYLPGIFIEAIVQIDLREPLFQERFFKVQDEDLCFVGRRVGNPE